MRKSVKKLSDQSPSSAGGPWLDLAEIAQVEVTSESPEFPIESALVPGAGTAWRAGAPGAQSILLKFDTPQRLKRILLRFVEEEKERTQEFKLSWSAKDTGSFREIVRQQWNFSPRGSTRESEDYRVDLSEVAALKLDIDPDLGRGEALASLAELRVG